MYSRPMIGTVVVIAALAGCTTSDPPSRTSSAAAPRPAVTDGHPDRAARPVGRRQRRTADPVDNPGRQGHEVQRLPEVDRSLGEGGRLGIPITRGDEGARYHQGGRLAFGPDGMLYASVGETYFTRDIAQDRANLGGKILRLTPDGRPAPGNPYPNSPVWSCGHRNVQGMAWDSSGLMYASELGASLFDELNVVRPGGNYGWPVVEGPGNDARFVNPIASWSPTRIASPSGIAVHGNHVYVACLRGRRLYRVSLDGRTVEALLVGDYGRLRTVTAAPDGALWITTSNRDQVNQEDGLATNPEDDRILRVTPPTG